MFSEVPKIYICITGITVSTEHGTRQCHFLWSDFYRKYTVRTHLCGALDATREH